MASYKYSGILPKKTAIELAGVCLMADTVDMDKEYLFGDGIRKSSVSVTTYTYMNPVLQHRHADESPVRLQIHIQDAAMVECVSVEIFRKLYLLRTRKGVRWAFWEQG
jgi:hypothetical protein